MVVYVAKHIKSLSSPVSLSVCFSSDEDDALYEKVSGEQWRVQCLVQLFGEMKDSDLPGEFFLLLLQVLTPWFQCSSTFVTAAPNYNTLDNCFL